MTSFQEDYILRIVEQVAAALAKIVGLKETALAENVFEEIEQATGLLLGAGAEVIAKLDSATAAELVKHPEAIELYARLLVEKAEVHRQVGESAAASRCYGRALELAIEAYRRESSANPELPPLIRSLQTKVAPEAISKPYLQELERME